jgi:hypothetical protein
MLVYGIQPSEVDLAVDVSVQGVVEGSFWGTVRTAAAYAEDTAKERDGGSPALIAIRSSDIIRLADLLPDLQTLDFPLKGLTRLDEREVLERWEANHAEMDWRRSLDDLGAVVALHGASVPSGYLMWVKSVGDLDCLFSLPTGQSLEM